MFIHGIPSLAPYSLYTAYPYLQIMKSLKQILRAPTSQLLESTIEFRRAVSGLDV